MYFVRMVIQNIRYLFVRGKYLNVQNKYLDVESKHARSHVGTHGAESIPTCII